MRRVVLSRRYIRSVQFISINILDCEVAFRDLGGITGTIDRVTGDTQATTSFGSAYSLHCRRVQRMF